MTITIDELFDSRSQTIGNTNSLELRYGVGGTIDDEQVRNLVLATAPDFYGGLILQTIDLTPKGAGWWEARAHYGELTLGNNTPEPGEPVRQSFSTGGGTQHITQSLETISVKTGPNELPVNHFNAINYDGQKVGGTDIVFPVFQWSETHYLDTAQITTAFKNHLALMTGRMNAAPFRGKERGEVLFLGVNGAPRNLDQWELNFEFAASPNITNLSVGQITGIDKLGWDYLWFEYAKDEGNGRLINKPVQATVERVYYFGDFSTLNIGTAAL